VPAELLAVHGAVSPECAIAMAEGARRAGGSDWALSVTGVAGPGGGTPAKPVGLVYIGVAGPAGATAHELRLRGDRERIRERATQRALHLLRLALSAGAQEGRAGTPR
jgi:nicotinamide-nucleotide amidase